MQNEEILHWIQANSKRISAGTDFAFLTKKLKQTTTVLIGEPVHGAHEFWKYKCLLSQFLIKEKNYNILALEMPSQDAGLLNDVVHSSSSNISEELNRTSYWMYKNTEFEQFLYWLQEFAYLNKNRNLEIIGVDAGINDSIRKEKNGRDKYMASQILEYKKTHLEARVVAWFHNAHAANIFSENYISVGGILKKKLEPLIIIGGVLGSGSFNALDTDYNYKEFEIDNPSSEFYSYYFTQVINDVGIIELTNKGTNEINNWLNGGLKVKEVGAIFEPEYEDEFSHQIDLKNKFDYILFVNKITPLERTATIGHDFHKAD